MATWYECSTLAESEAVDAVAEIFGRIGQGVAIEEPIFSSPDGEEVRILTERPVLVKTYLPQDERTEERRRQLDEAIWYLGRLRRVEPLQVKAIQETDWAEAWKSHFFVHRVGQRLVIVPSWREFEADPGDLPIHLDPGMAFGTGLHPTTQLCLRALEEEVGGGEAVLDLGTGSGILAIAAMRLGARSVLGLDVESVAVRVAAENVAQNGLSGAIEIREGSLPLGPEAVGTFDLVVANISFRVLNELAVELRRAMSERGKALLSGVLEQNADELITVLGAAGLTLREKRAEADWTLMILEPGR